MKERKNLKIFCGYSNTGGIAYKIAEGLRKNGIRADAVVAKPHMYYPHHKANKYFKNRPLKFLNRLLKYYYFLKYIFQYDIFIFNTRDTLLSRKWDLPVLKFLGKKTAMVYVGCDIRDKNYYLKSKDKYTVCKECTDDYQKSICCVMEDKIRETSYIAKFAGKVYSHPFDAGILKNNFNYLYLLLELENYNLDNNWNSNGKIKILHAPSNDGIKGTAHIIKSAEELRKQKVDFDFEVIRNKENREVIEAIMNCDIVIDQMTAGWYGLISIEAMALGKPVVCYIKEELYNYLPDLPVINLNPDTLTEGLKKLIANRDELKILGKKGREFVEKYHDYKKNSLIMLNEILASN